MSVVKLGTNIASLQAQRSLATASSKLSNIFERLSSGQRINKASDDAAGLSISSMLNADKRVYSQGIRNINDGVSALTIAGGALESLTTIVTRLKELATQAASGTFGVRQRKSLDEEAQSLSKEYFRIARTAEFNGLNLLDGTVDEIRLQAGFGEGGSIASGLGGAIGTGSFAVGVSFATGNSPDHVALADFNGDGLLDMVTANSSSDNVTVFLGSGDGTFSASTSYATGSWPYSVALGDLNGDGVIDIVTSDGGDGGATVLLGKGNGAFSSVGSFKVGAGGTFATLGDMNGDGILDIVGVDSIFDKVGVLLGNGDGTFAAVKSYTTGAGPWSIATADFNSDGVLDVVTTDFVSDGISILLGNQDGTLKARSVLATGNTPEGLALGDLNGDGLADIVTADYGSGRVSIFISKGDGTFHPRVSIECGSQQGGLALGDLNGDGALDIVTVGIGNVSMLLGNGDGSFLARTTMSTTAWARTIALGDLNADGVLDLVTAGSSFANSNATSHLAQTKDGVSPLLPFDLTTMAGARQAMPLFDQKLSQLAVQQGQIGAFHSRLNTAVSVLGNTVENYAAAASRITDTDIAQETAELVRTQILQQAAAAVLSTANLQSNLVLKLLGNG